MLLESVIHNILRQIHSLGKNSRYAAALALVGWYLIMPPIRSADTAHPIPDSDAPLSKWTTEGTFDSAVACNRYLSSLLMAANSNTLPIAESKLQVENAKCIATDDPRLAK